MKTEVVQSLPGGIYGWAFSITDPDCWDYWDNGQFFANFECTAKLFLYAFIYNKNGKTQ